MKIQIKLCIIIIGLITFRLSQAYVTVGPVSDLNCDYNDLQTAINSALVETEIRVTNTIEVTGNTSVQNKPITHLSGGYNSCAEDADIGENTTVSNDSGTALYLYFSQPTTAQLDVTNFNFINSNTGIRVGDSFADELYNMAINLNNINVFNNGTGIDFDANQISLTIDYSKIYENGNYDSDGGGFKCNNGEGLINILEHTAINNNQARNGAGIYLAGCHLNLYAGGYNNNIEYGVFDNSAYYAGGGIYMFNSEVLASGDENHPVIISNNETTYYDSDGHGGAGVYISKNSSIDFVNAFIDNNHALGYGAAIYARYYTNLGGNPPEITVNRHANGCTYAEYCSSISHNSTPFGFTGSVFDGYGDFSINQTLIKGNKADRAVFSLTYNSVNSDIIFEGNLIVENTAFVDNVDSRSLFYSKGETNSIHLNFTTISNNGVEDIFYLSYDNSSPQTLLMYNSIINNNNSDIINHEGAEGDHFVNIDCSILHNDTTGNIDQSNIQVTDALLTNTYKLNSDSPARDVNCSSLNPPLYLDLVGNNRLFDWVADLGAFEYEFIDVIFSNGFD